MRSEDWIQGPVTRVFDGDTFEMAVTLVGKTNDYPYGPKERIRIDSSAPPPGTEAGDRAKWRLEALVAGKEVRCYVKSRDEKGFLYCDVTVGG